MTATVTYKNHDGSVIASYTYEPSPGISCSCKERKQPLTVPEGSNQRPRQWAKLYTVWAGTGALRGRETSRTYSYIACRVCGSHWKTYSDAIISACPTTEELGYPWPGSHLPFVPPIED